MHKINLVMRSIEVVLHPFLKLMVIKTRSGDQLCAGFLKFKD